MCFLFVCLFVSLFRVFQFSYESLLSHAPYEGHLGCFQIWAIKNKAAILLFINEAEHFLTRFMCETFYCSVIILRVQMVKHTKKCICILNLIKKNTAKLFSKGVVPFCVLISNKWEVIYSSSLIALCTVRLSFNFSHFYRHVPHIKIVTFFSWI